MLPVTPHDFHPVTNNKIWVPHGIGVKCPQCDTQTLVKLPICPKRGEVHLYGDEAAREQAGIYTYSLLGAAMPLMPQIEHAIFNLKRSVAPSVVPESWRLHMTEAWSSEKRRRHPIFKEWSIGRVVGLIDSLFELLASLSDDLFIFNVSLTNLPATQTELRDLAYISLVAELIDGFTATGFQPHLRFDADRPVTGEYAIQSWATDSFGGLQRTLLYPFLAKGIPIPEPRFVRPGSHPCLELADFVSFVVARYLWQLHQGKEIEFQPARLGKVFYMVRRRNGGLLQLRQTGYPSAEPC